MRTRRRALTLMLAALLAAPLAAAAEPKARVTLIRWPYT